MGSSPVVATIPIAGNQSLIDQIHHGLNGDTVKCF